jgi:asparagine synthase (glutamine-hydrolysing)
MLIDDETLLVHRRLSIIDLSPRGTQPLWNEDRSVAVIVNGEIYNYRELRHGLEQRGHRFASDSDSEVIVHLFEERGIDETCRALEGMFAFALWDTRARALFLVRDRLGIKPLVVAEHGGGITFASTLPGVLADPDVPRDVRPEALLAVLKWGFVPSPWSAVKACRHLLPGTWMRIQHGRIAEERPWWRDDPSPASGDDHVVRRAVEEAVRTHLVADVPVGALLSAGIDSGLVTGLASRIAPGTVEAWTVSHRGYPQDEFPEAQRAAEHFSVRSHEVPLGGNALNEAAFDQLIAALDEPLVDTSLVGLHAMYGRIAPYRRVVLSGDGGDELFAGYDWHFDKSAAPWWGQSAPFRVLAPALRRLPRWSRQLGALRDVARYVAQHPALHYIHRFRLMVDQELARQGIDVSPGDPLAAKAIEVWDRYALREPLERMLAVDRATLLVDQMLAKIDVASMAHSVEARVPLLADGVVAAAKTLPAGRKRRDGHGKLCLRDWYREIGPSELADRAKTGFNSPLAAWLRADEGAFLHERSAAAMGELGARTGAPSDRFVFATAVIGAWLERLKPEALTPVAVAS